MIQAVEVRVLSNIEDCVGKNLIKKIDAALNLKLEDLRISKVYLVQDISKEELQKAVEKNALHDPIIQEALTSPVETSFDFVVSVNFKPGVTDNEGKTAANTLSLVLNKDEPLYVYTTTCYYIKTKLDKKSIESITKDILVNDLIQDFAIQSMNEWNSSPGVSLKVPHITASVNSSVSVIPVTTMNNHELMDFSSKNTLALSLEELLTIQNHYKDPKTQDYRRKNGLPLDPTDAEIEVLAQTWSEHCKHKIFSAKISYTNEVTGKKETINSLYKTCIQNTTSKLRKKMGENDYCRSVFKDNAGVVAFNDTHDVCIKVETHNSPSALDPYGGALTGIVGVNRDVIGTGMGGEMVCNTDVFCFASPFYSEPLPPRLLHPRRIMEGVREGVEHGGNKSGVPTVNGSLVFDDRFLGKPLVYCGTVGILPKDLNGKPGYEKKANVGDAIVMVGGRIGKDGIHGATFSSEALHESSPATAVQIGDPITQRKMYDFILKARDEGLYSSITDNGAGGLSSSVGEMAEDTGGCYIDLSKAPLKYNGLFPWEILLSEAQERMTIAVPQKNITKFMEMAKKMDVEASILGNFNDSGYFHVVYENNHVAMLDMNFLHDGLPQMKLQAKWEKTKDNQTESRNLNIDSKKTDLSTVISSKNISPEDLLLKMLGRLNICSKEYLIRQYDHEVKGGSVVKPLIGSKQDGPANAGVIRPVLDDYTGLVISHGICPKFSDADTYWMAANAIDEAIRNAVATGADPSTLAAVDNFCWCDPIASKVTPDGEYKLAQLVRANKALEQFCLGFEIPCISGKDSMKNDYMGGGEKISIPPTLLFSVLGKVPNCELATTPDVKKAGDKVYILGITRDEFAGSEIAQELDIQGGNVPNVDIVSAKNRYHLIHQLICKKLISACHDLSDGGLAVSLAEMALAGRLGMNIDLCKVPCVNISTPEEILYSESASRLVVTVSPEKEEEFIKICGNNLGFDIVCIGTVADSNNFRLISNNKEYLNTSVEELANAFTKTLKW